MAKGNYCKSLFDEVKCTRSYWSLIKTATEVKKRNICDISKLDGSLTNSDKEKGEVLNEYFADVWERLAQNLLQGNQLNIYPVNKVTPTRAYKFRPRKIEEKNSNVTAVYKNDDEAEKGNYRPISILCIPAKILETCFANAMINHLEVHNLSSNHQWAYKKATQQSCC
ncbi:Hypothetical predicted protein [Paramuricea clavata]|uniref:Uncharacterized protein n=1 Tax=Paramuricea clavata TaxID=317549 RepID=A0A7D9DPH4_PARCT|nr:Hypothetical predicted protein [Paramuricea clavata]